MRDVGENWGQFTDSSQGGDSENPRYCLRCQERLPWYDSGPFHCLKCQLQFNPNDPTTFRVFRQLVQWKFWFPGFALAVCSGVITYALLLSAGSELAASLFIAVPISIGAILGYGTRAKTWMIGMLGIAAITTVVVLLMTMDFCGFFCGLALGLIFIVPVGFGILLGALLRVILAGTRWDQRWFFPLIAFVLFPYAAWAIEMSFPRQTQTATVQTAVSIHATPAEAWEAIMFYEEVEHGKPWLLKLSLPNPVRSEGDKQSVGSRVRCVYERGYLVKKITEYERGRKLAFEVVEQELHFERDVTLLDGSFEIQPLADNRTRILLTTRYQRHLSPAWMWQPIERMVVHALHGHVLEGMRRHAEGSPPTPVPESPYPPHANKPLAGRF